MINDCLDEANFEAKQSNEKCCYADKRMVDCIYYNFDFIQKTCFYWPDFLIFGIRSQLVVHCSLDETQISNELLLNIEATRILSTRSLLTSPKIYDLKTFCDNSTLISDQLLLFKLRLDR